ncbi:MAG TPA: phosphoribosyltransferase [Bryobacteraceae bacterium]|nr:phosphoribosyltransferase [Bryobacteraceae bacterium]
MMFHDRAEAGPLLAAALRAYKDRPGVVVLGLPRGGVPLARIIAGFLGAPLDVFLVRKLGVPWQPELGFGAIAETPGTDPPVRVIDEGLVRECELSPEVIEEIASREQREIERRGRVYRGPRSLIEVRGREVILVDDGLATGSTMLAAVRALRHQNAARIIVAVPVGSRTACQMLRREADELVCLSAPEHFESVGSWYEDFTQVTDREVQEALSSAPETQKSANRPR